MNPDTIESLSDLIGQSQLSDAARKSLLGARSIAEGLQRLIDAEAFPDAYQFVGITLKVREAVWWGCLCSWDSARPHAYGRKSETPPWTTEDDEALRASVKWVREPTAESADDARTRGAALGTAGPAGALALAAGWGGNPNDKGRALSAAAGAALLAAVRGGPDPVHSRVRRYLGLGLQIARGELRWE